MYAIRSYYEILVPDLAAGVLPGDPHELGGAIEADGFMAQIAETAQIAAGAAADIENAVRRRPLDGAQQGSDVLADVVIGGAVPVAHRVEFIVRQGVLGQGGVVSYNFV